MPDNSWIISVAGQAYGPFDGQQMRVFAGEGRLVPATLVARPGEPSFRPAADEPELNSLFSSGPSPSQVPVTQTLPAERARVGAFGKLDGDGDDDGSASQESHLIIISDMKSRSITGLEEEIVKLGPSYRLLPQVWMLTTEVSVNALRNLLIQQLGKLDVLLIIDATRDKAAWYNFGPEADSRIRRLWTRHSDSRSAKL